MGEKYFVTRNVNLTGNIQTAKVKYTEVLGESTNSTLNDRNFSFTLFRGERGGITHVSPPCLDACFIKMSLHPQ